MANHNEIGKKGEVMARQFLEEKGYEILTINYRYKNFEIDIIAQNNNRLIVVEVKTRQSSYLAGPQDTVSRSKQSAIIKCANAYILENEVDLETQFDIISIIFNRNGQKIEHFEDAFYPLM